uniref:(northern house mosquito) hypothetical protein n=1 Tax=Culex pipiens TaxID=7175 RepID=A0A8D8HQC1_CULPI
MILFENANIQFAFYYPSKISRKALIASIRNSLFWDALIRPIPSTNCITNSSSSSTGRPCSASGPSVARYGSKKRNSSSMPRGWRSFPSLRWRWNPSRSFSHFRRHSRGVAASPMPFATASHASVFA